MMFITLVMMIYEVKTTLMVSLLVYIVFVGLWGFIYTLHLVESDWDCE